MKWSSASFRSVGVIFLVLVVSSCATASKTNLRIDQALEMCRALAGPDAEKGEGEVWFWLNARRSDISRSLWNSPGVNEISRRLDLPLEAGDRACLLRLLQEAEQREIVRDG